MNIKRLTNTILIITIIVILAAIGYFAFITNSQPFAKITTPAPISSNPTLTNPAQNLKTYTNAQYGFEVKIPIDWEVDELSSANSLFFYSLISKNENDARTLRCKDPVLQEKEPRQCSEISWDMYFINTTYGMGASNTEVINGVTWTVIEGENSGWGYETNHNGKSYHFSLPHLPENKALLVQFLSTFKFIK